MKKIILTDLSSSEYKNFSENDIKECIEKLNEKINNLNKDGQHFYGKLNELGLYYYEMDTRAFHVNNISLEDNKICAYIGYVYSEVGKAAERYVEKLKYKFRMLYSTAHLSPNEITSINGWMITIEDIKERKIWEEDHSKWKPEGYI